jgi:DNA repair exonuclease SbcCD nuclease subunit
MIYLAADLHLRECTWKSRKDINGDQYYAWAQLCKAVSNDPEGELILAGDIFDTPYPTGNTELMFSKGMKLLGNHKCYFIPGNHDNEQVPRPMLFGAELLKSDKVVNIQGLKVLGIPFMRSTETLQSVISSIPPVDILVMHTGFQHLLGFEETWQVSEGDIPETTGMVMVGHVHKHDEHGKIYSPGSLALHRADEIYSGHGYYKINPLDKSVEWVEVFTRKYVSIDVDKRIDRRLLDSLAESKDWKRPVVLLNYRNEDTTVAEALQEIYKDKILFMCNACSSETIRALDEEPETELDIDSVINNYLTGNLTEEQLGLAVTLMNSQDPAEDLSTYLEERK